MNKILKFSFLICLVALFQSCSKEENDLISQQCEFECTTITGKFMTDNGEVPIPNAKLIVKWDNIPYLGSGIIRTKATTLTDSEGNFTLNFSIRDEELEDGGFYIEYVLNEEQYLNSYQNRITLYQISRDTTVEINYNIPRKAFINLSLINLDEIQPADNFATDFYYERPIGFDQSVDGQTVAWSSQSSGNNLVEVAGNQPILLKVRRRINGVDSVESDTLIIEAGTTINYTVDFN
jgi:hypothetical protein